MNKEYQVTVVFFCCLTRDINSLWTISALSQVIYSFDIASYFQHSFPCLSFCMQIKLDNSGNLCDTVQNCSIYISLFPKRTKQTKKKTLGMMRFPCWRHNAYQHKGQGWTLTFRCSTRWFWGNQPQMPIVFFEKLNPFSCWTSFRTCTSNSWEGLTVMREQDRCNRSGILTVHCQNFRVFLSLSHWPCQDLDSQDDKWWGQLHPLLPKHWLNIWSHSQMFDWYI